MKKVVNFVVVFLVMGVMLFGFVMVNDDNIGYVYIVLLKYYIFFLENENVFVLKMMF